MAIGLTRIPDGVGDFTGEINKVPNMFGKIRGMGLFKKEYTSQININVDVTDSGLTIIPAELWGSPGYAQKNQESELISFLIKQLSVVDGFGPEDIQGKRVPGTPAGIYVPDTIMVKKLAKMRMRFDQTLEFMELSAVKGKLLDGSGKLMYDYFDKFGITQKIMEFDLDNDAADLSKSVRELKSYISLNHRSTGIITGYTVLCSRSWFEKFIGHSSIKERYDSYASVQEPLRKDVSDGFRFMGVDFEVYEGSVALIDGTTKALIDEGKAHAFPRGLDLFETWYAPGYGMDWVNKMGSEFYLQTEKKEMKQGVKMWATSCPLPICKRPEALVELGVKAVA